MIFLQLESFCFNACNPNEIFPFLIQTDRGAEVYFLNPQINHNIPGILLFFCIFLSLKLKNEIFFLIDNFQHQDHEETATITGRREDRSFCGPERH